ncbi:ABC transporter substrate-binding protein [Paraburkholderia phosphatilytica]|uniref:ABC transporter substrate-binding protein n=1 Tax=Paraburkholderia phosphatilytica TaxID=2282883 RepID=UPI003B8359FE
MNLRTTTSAFIVAAFAVPAPSVMADTTVRIGQVSLLTGELAHIGKDDENGVRMAIEDLNSRKIRIGGQLVTFELDSQDDAADPRTAVTVAQKLVDPNRWALIRLTPVPVHSMDFPDPGHRRVLGAQGRGMFEPVGVSWCKSSISAQPRSPSPVTSIPPFRQED